MVANALVDMYAAKRQAVSESNSIPGRISNKDVAAWNRIYAENDMANDALQTDEAAKLLT